MAENKDACSTIHSGKPVVGIGQTGSRIFTKLMLTRLDPDDTIVAIASAAGPALRGIIRLSGPHTIAVLCQFFDGTPFGEEIRTRFHGVADSRSAARNAVALDCPLSFAGMPVPGINQLLVWPTGQSYSRQPSAEIHTIGCQPILQRLLGQILDAGCRLAEPGEFTLRAFLAGRLDLTQAEAVLGVIEARNETQFRDALTQLAGGIGGPITEVRNALLSVLADLEAGLDFVDEDIEFVTEQGIVDQLHDAQQSLANAIHQVRQRQSHQETITVVLAGQPNVGKSSLFNRLAAAAAIVSEIAGTTRDYLTADVDFDGVWVRLIDTAGIDASVASSNRHQDLDLTMMQQSHQRISAADLTLICVPTDSALSTLELSLLDNKLRPALLVRTKNDLQVTTETFPCDVAVSAHTGQGIPQLRGLITAAARRCLSHESTSTITLTRALDSLHVASSAIEFALTAMATKTGEELVAIDIRNAIEHLGQVVGTVYTDDLLDLVFSRFCIGK